MAQVQVLDVRGNRWSAGAPASLPAVGAAAVALDQEILVFGGRTAGNKVSRRTAVYDVQADQWEIGPDLVLPIYDAAAAQVDGRIILAGGRTEVDGPGLPVSQEFDVAADAWRPGLPQPLPVAAAGGAAVDGMAYVVGGLAAADEEPGTLTHVVQRLEPGRGWRSCGDLPTFTAEGVLSAAALGVGPRTLTPGTLAVLLGANLPGPGTPFEITVGGLPALVAGFFPQPPAIYFLVPPNLDPAAGSAELRLTVQGAPLQPPPVTIPVAALAPGIFVFNNGEFLEPAFLDSCGALACNASGALDGTLNYASQPAEPGGELLLWATGLGPQPDKDPDIGKRLKAEIGGKKAAVLAVVPPPVPLPGVFLVRVKVPAEPQLASYSPAVLRAGKHQSNRASVAVRKPGEVQPPPQPVPCGLPFAIGAAFPFLIPMPQRTEMREGLQR